MRRVWHDDAAGAGAAAERPAVADRLEVVHHLDPVPRDYARSAQTLRRTTPWLRSYTLSLVTFDLLAAILAATVSLLAFPTRYHVLVMVAVPVGWVAALALGRTYEHRFVGNGGEEYRRLFHTGAVVVAVVATAGFAAELQAARGLVVLGLPLTVLLSLGAHWATRQALQARRRRGCCMHRAVIVGLERSVAELTRTIRREPHSGLHIIGVCVDRPQGEHVEGVPVLGDSDHIVEVLRETGADTVAVTAWSDVSQNDLRRLSWDLEGSGVSILVAPRLTDVSGPRIHIRPVAGLPLLNVEEPEFTGVRRMVKGAIDRGLALLACVLLAPVFVLVAVAVRVSSPGPVLFRQERVGRQGAPFRIHKFRSMYVDAEERLAGLRHLNESDGLLFKLQDDPRVTQVGRVLRRFSLDELPQFFDVLLGRMSLVGPRPPLPQEVERYPWELRRRLVVKPGITGLWQVSGRSDLSWEDSVRLDLLYVENWSLALDFTIILRTVVAVLRRQGAY